MTIIDELLIILESGQKFTIAKIKNMLSKRSLQTISSTLGRLVAKGYVNVCKVKKENEYTINDRGLELVNNTLAEIKKVQNMKWDGTWHIAVFNIPEKIRYTRDTLRIKLNDLGFGRILNSLWISAQDKSVELNKLVKDLKIEKYFTIVNTGKTKEDDNKNIANRFEWDWDILNKEYKNFINQSRSFFLSRKNNFEAKKLVYQYAKVLKLDPQFPQELQPKNYLGNKAFALYQKIRPYCYSKK